MREGESRIERNDTRRLHGDVSGASGNGPPPGKRRHGVPQKDTVTHPGPPGVRALSTRSQRRRMDSRAVSVLLVSLGSGNPRTIHSADSASVGGWLLFLWRDRATRLVGAHFLPRRVLLSTCEVVVCGCNSGQARRWQSRIGDHQHTYVHMCRPPPQPAAACLAATLSYITHMAAAGPSGDRARVRAAALQMRAL